MKTTKEIQDEFDVLFLNPVRQDIAEMERAVKLMEKMWGDEELPEEQDSEEQEEHDKKYCEHDELRSQCPCIDCRQDWAYHCGDVEYREQIDEFNNIL